MLFFKWKLNTYKGVTCNFKHTYTYFTLNVHNTANVTSKQENISNINRNSSCGSVLSAIQFIIIATINRVITNVCNTLRFEYRLSYLNTVSYFHFELNFHFIINNIQYLHICRIKCIKCKQFQSNFECLCARDDHG